MTPGMPLRGTPVLLPAMLSLRLRLLLTLVPLSLLAACDQLGIESASAVAEKRLAEGKAVGGACRHAARAIEDCYTLNRKTDKAAMYAGWREMDDYMRENKLEPVKPVLPPPVDKPRRAASAASADADGEAAEKPAEPAAETAATAPSKDIRPPKPQAKGAKAEKVEKADKKPEAKTDARPAAAAADHGASGKAD